MRVKMLLVCFSLLFFITYILLSLNPPPTRAQHISHSFYSTKRVQLLTHEQESEIHQSIRSKGQICSRHWASNSVLSSPRLKHIRLFVAMMLHNNCPIMPHLSSQLLRLSASMTPQNVHISILESGSVDCTPRELETLRRSLNALGAKTSINQDASLSIGNFTSECVDKYPARYWHWSARIPFLAHLRNVALGPLFNDDDNNNGDINDKVNHNINDDNNINRNGSSSDNSNNIKYKYDRVLFLNDVLFCAEDLAMLLLQPPAHILSGIDVQRESLAREADGGKQLKLGVYDRWVFRDINGSVYIDDPRGEYLSEMVHTTKMYPPFSNLTHTRRHVDRAEPFPVQCTWGAAALIDARIFLEHGVKFRAAAWPGECSASECSLFCNDVWRIYGAKTRVVVDPRVVVAYTSLTWDLLWAIRLHKIPITKVHAQWYSLLAPSNPQAVLEKILDPRNPTLPIIPDSGEIVVPRVVVCVPTMDCTHAELRYPYPDTAWMNQIPEVPAGACPNDRIDENEQQQQRSSQFREWFRSINTCSSDHSPTIALHTTNLLTTHVQLLVPAKTPIMLQHGAIWIAANIRPGQEVLFADQMRRLLQNEEILSYRRSMFLSVVIVGANRWDSTHSAVLSTLHAITARAGGIALINQTNDDQELLRAHVTAATKALGEHILTSRKSVAFVFANSPFCASKMASLLLVAEEAQDSHRIWCQKDEIAVAILSDFALGDGPDALIEKLPNKSPFP